MSTTKDQMITMLTSYVQHNRLDYAEEVYRLLELHFSQNSGKPIISGSAGYVLKWIAGCPYNIDEATVPKSGIDTAPEQVVLNLSLSYKVWLALQEVAKHCH